MPPLLQGENDKTLRRMPDGRLALQTATCCEKCSDNQNEEPCELWTFALPCYEILDSQCDRTFPAILWLCAKTYYSEHPPTDPEYKLPGGVTFLASGHCYTTQGQYFNDAQMPPNSPRPEAYKIDILIGGCQNPVCGIAPSQCACLCYNYTSAGYNQCGQLYEIPPIETWCCLGKFGSHPGVPGRMGICWNVGWNSTVEQFTSFTPRRNSQLPAYSCLWSKTASRSFNLPNYDYCDNGCCIDLGEEQTVLVARTLPSPSNNYTCTDAPGIPIGVWQPITYPGTEIPFATPYCTPVNVGSCGSAGFLFGDDTLFDGCYGKGYRTVSVSQTCAGTALTYFEEQWLIAQGVCQDANGPFNCCEGQEYSTYKHTYNVDYVTPQSGDFECGACKQEIAQTLGGNGFAQTGDITDLF